VVRTASDAVDTSAGLYVFLFSIALETAAMFAMMVAYSSSKIAPTVEAPAPAETPAEPSPPSALDGRALSPTQAVEQTNSSGGSATSRSSAAVRSDSWSACVRAAAAATAPRANGS